MSHPSVLRRAISRALAPLMVALVALVALADAAAAKPTVDTIIDSGPAPLTRSTTASFTFHATDKSATFVCKLDGSAYVACSSPTTLSGLAAGSHTFMVDASANGVSDPTPATTTWTIDVSAPTPPSNLAGTSPTSTSIALTWAAGTDNIGVTGNLINRDGSQMASVGAVTSYTDSTVAAGSTHTYTVQAQDGAGNISGPSNSATVSTPPAPSVPDTIIDTGPPSLTNSTSATFTFHATVQGSTFTCKLDAQKPAGCTSPHAYSGLSSGSHTFSVYATASTGSDPTPATSTWTIDTVPPSVPTGLTASTSPSSVTLTWTASTDNVAVTGYDIFRGGSLLVSLGAVTTYADGTISFGQHYSYAVRARDGAGNVSALSTAVAVTPMGMFDPRLTRAPYLTDLVALHVAINWATDQSATTASARYGTVGADGACSLATEVAASRITILVGTVYEYQWKVDLTLPATGTYCYRVYLAGGDLLGSNAAPAFTTQVQFGSTESYSFVVFGDWGQVDASGQNPGQAGLMSQIAGSGARFAIAVGDTGYVNGSQINYGDLQQSGADTSAIFGPQFWTIPGSSIPFFNAVGNHGVSGVKHTDITTWTQATAVSQSGGRYQNDVYCCVNGSFSANYGSEWYAFSAGNVRFYILDSAWGDTNAGTANPYANDALAHFAPGTPEYTWLLNDLTTHPTQLKFAFSHYPFYSDNSTQPSDTYLDGPANLEGLLGQHGVQLVFNGHAHIYERNRASAAGMPITYVTGGGGATLEPMGTCSTLDAYGIGWSPTHLSGTSCGNAPIPTSDAQVYHFLKVTVSGTTVTVAPTDSTGRTFDVQTYTFKVPTDTYIDSGPPVGTTSTSATFTFHASGSPATFKCQLDLNAQTSCLSPISYSNVAQGRHTFKVTATYNKSVDPTPAQMSWTVDTTSPSVPANLAATATSPFTVNLSWSAATDNTGVVGYDLYRDGSLYQSLGAVTTYGDVVLGSSTHQYAVRARDIAGNVSALGNVVTVTSPPPPPPLFTDGFESGDFSAWNSNGGLVIESTNVNTGAYAAEGNTTNGNTFAKEVLPGTYTDAYARLWLDVVSQTSQINVLRFRDASGNSIGYVYVDSSGLLGFHNDATGTNTLSGFAPSPGWHALELHVKTDATAGVVEVWVDNMLVADLSGSGLNTGPAPVAQMQIGDVQTGRTYDVVFDDAAFGTSRLGPDVDTVPPSVPTGLAATVVSPFEADLSWNASTDNVGVSGYDVFRDGTLVASLGTVLSYADTSTTAGVSHTYTVRSRDVSGNVSAQSSPVTVTQPAAPPPLFGDGFETGDMSSWTATSGLVVESGDMRSGTYAAEGSTASGSTFARKTLPSTYTDAYARVAFEVKSQGSQVTLLRLRDTPTGNGGYLYLTAGGKLGFRSDALTTGTTSSVAPGAGWHALELHLHVNGTSSVVEVWLDGTFVSDISSTAIDLGTAPMGILQIGDTAPSGTWDVVFDDAGFGTSRLGPAGDTNPPSVPANLAGSASTAFSVQLTWDPSTDDVGVTGYDVFRDGAIIAETTATSYADTSVLAESTHQYAIRARDISGNVSALSPAITVTTPAPAPPIYADGFESSDTSRWTSALGLNVEQTDVHSGIDAAEANTATGATYAKETLASTYADAYARVAFELKSQASQLTLLRLRDTPTGNGGYVYLTSSGKLAFHNDATGLGGTSSVVIGPGWHVVELHLQINGASSLDEVWLDGAAVTDLDATGIDLGLAPIGVLQIGETAAGGTWDVVFDDAAFGSSRIGPFADPTPPSVPANLAATAPTPFSVQLTWDPSTDNTGLANYDVFRDGAYLTSASSNFYSDGTVLAATTHQYAVRARDLSGNLSSLSAPVSVTTPLASTPVFADGFESADQSGWTTSSGITIESIDVHSGGFAAEGNTTTGGTFAKKTLSSTYQDAYARVAFDVYSQGSQTTLLRLRDTPTGNGGYLFITATGKLAFRSDALQNASISSVAPGGGWHVLELHLFVNGTSSMVEVWLDGAAVPDLTSTSTTLGPNPIGVIQIGDTATTGTWDVLFDDAAFGTSRLGVGGDASAPSVPGNLNATASSPFSVQLTWDASTDNVGVTGYDVMRDGGVIAQVVTPGYTDNTVLAGETHEYTVRARDGSGNVSALSASDFVTTPMSATPLFADGFETGDTTSWTTTTGLTVESTDTHAGAFAAEGVAAASAAYAKKSLPTTYSDAYARVAFEVKSQGSAVTLLRLRDTPTGNGGYILLNSTGRLAFHNDATAATTNSVVQPGIGWHVVELHLQVNGTSSVVETWLDGVAVPDLTFSGVNLGTAPIGVLQVGDTASGTWDVVFDDAAFNTSRLGPTGDTNPPTMPANMLGSALSPFSIQVSWDPSADDVAVTGYDLLRDGLPIAELTTTSYTDNTVLANTTHLYSVRARDGSGNVSAFASVLVTTPAAATPIFSDGFEGGNFSAWNTGVTGLAIESADVHSGADAAEGNVAAAPTFAKKTLPATYADAYARVAFEIKSQTSSRVGLLRMRATASTTGAGYVYITSAGKLGFHNDITNTDTVSAFSPGPGWHVLELHLQLNGTSSVVEVWVDGAAVTDLTSSSANLGTGTVGAIQVGETANVTCDAVFDDAAFGTSRIGVG